MSIEDTFLSILIIRCSQIAANVSGNAFFKGVKALIVSRLAQLTDVGLGEVLVILSNRHWHLAKVDPSLCIQRFANC